MKGLLCLIALLLTVLPAIAQPGVSRPAGILRIELPPRAYTAAAQPFDPWDSSLGAVFFNQLTGSTNAAAADHIFVWNTVSQTYHCWWKSSNGWVMEGERSREPSVLPLTISAGAGFFLQNNQSFTQHVYLAGEILLDAEHETLLPPAFTLAGYPYATAIPVLDTALSSVLPASGSPTLPLFLMPGHAFWVFVTNSCVWTEPCRRNSKN